MLKVFKKKKKEKITDFKSTHSYEKRVEESDRIIMVFYQKRFLQI